jgi:hypothetical protein
MAIAKYGTKTKMKVVLKRVGLQKPTGKATWKLADQNKQLMN